MPHRYLRKKPRNISGIQWQHHNTSLVSKVLSTTSKDEYHKPCAHGVDNQSDLELDGADNDTVVFGGLKLTLG